jgi:eukaryotic-like serine/threonine-protein kinase
MNDHWGQLQDLFGEVCTLDEDSRRTILDQRCNGDQQLRSEAERMVRAYDQERTANAEARAASVGRRFGVWQTTRMLARGGMGEVWLARRADGQHEQQTALKILSPYLAAPDSVHRFRREREMLARLEHPNIARLLDGGLSSQGEPYLVMEYVEGIRLDDYCDQHRQSLHERLRLFLKVCGAVNSAHQYLVVHRDLKPGNILVAADGEPKLLDFGIAKLIDSEAGLEQTATANIFLTPMYASPEILRGQPAAVASDIYSLGVLLYELLAGRRPFDAAKLSPAGLVEAITQKDATRPSLAVASESSDIAALRDTTPEKLKTALDGDLDSIALKALAKKTEERYASVAQLAEDIRRYLNGQPVTAVQATWLYVTRKFVRRNALAVSAAAVLLLSLAAGIAGTLWQAHIAKQERANADQRFNDARQLANYLLFELYDSVGKVPGTMPVQAEMAGRTLEYLDRLAAIKSNDPALRLELGQGYLRLGTILGGKFGLGDTLGNNARAIEIGRKALGIVEPLVREHPEDAAARRTLALVEDQLGGALSRTGQYSEAFQWLQKSAESFDRIAGSDSRDLRALQDAGRSWQIYGKLLSEKSGYITFNSEAPLQYLNKSVNYLEAALRIDSNNPQTIQSLAESYEYIGRIEATPSPEKGIQAYSKALDLLARLPERERQSVEVQQLRARLLVLVGWGQGQLGDFKHSLANLEEARPILDAQAAADPQNVGAQFRRVDLYRSLGLVNGYAGNAKESLKNLQNAVEILDVIVKRDAANAIYPLLRAELQGRIANLLLQAGRKSEAGPYAEASVAYFRKIGDSADATPQQLIEAVRSVAEIGVPSLRDYPAALRFALRADQLASGKNPAALGYLAEAYGLNKNYPKAVDAAQRALAVTPPTKPGEPPSRLRQWLEDELKEYQAKAR